MPSIMNAATIGAGAAMVTGGGCDRVGTDHDQAKQAGRGERAMQRDRLPVTGRGARRIVEPGDDPLAKMGRGRDRRDVGEQGAEAQPPAIDLAGEGGLGEHPAQRRGALLALEQAKRELGGGDIGQSARRCDRRQSSPRQSLSRRRPRRTQLFIVPSGTASRAASSA